MTARTRQARDDGPLQSDRRGRRALAAPRVEDLGGLEVDDEREPGRHYSLRRGERLAHRHPHEMRSEEHGPEACMAKPCLAGLADLAHKGRGGSVRQICAKKARNNRAPLLPVVCFRHYAPSPRRAAWLRRRPRATGTDLRAHRRRPAWLRLSSERASTSKDDEASSVSSRSEGPPGDGLIHADASAICSRSKGRLHPDSREYVETWLMPQRYDEQNGPECPSDETVAMKKTRFLLGAFRYSSSAA